ncbi:hypothetical protein [Domibacillus sp. PGB-M46]|uniref:hypothetical protein n=1 Tax=Domibacillus sp. PGB-M46 TaxID=2910255 RepID=UPI001F58EB14|nr:hypothetical protein [Domibacillus sp. PGB-M46]
MSYGLFPDYPGIVPTPAKPGCLFPFAGFIPLFAPVGIMLGERYLDRVEVAGSNPVGIINVQSRKFLVFKSLRLFYLFSCSGFA